MFGNKVGKRAQDIINNLYLSVTVRSGADADGGNFYLLGDELGQGGGDGFQNDSKSPGLLQGAGVFQKPGGGFGGLALELETAELVY